MRLRNALSRLFLGATLMYGGSALAQQAANPYIRATEVAQPSDAINPKLPGGQEMTPEEFGALFGAEPTGAAAKTVLTAGADPVLTEGELTEILDGVKGTGQTLKPYLHLGTVGMEICTPNQKKCIPCVPGFKYELPTAGNDDIITFVCPERRTGKGGAASGCSSLYENHGTCLDDTLAGAFGLTEKTQNGSCAGKNTACYNATGAKKFATDEDLAKVIEQMKKLAETVDQQNKNVETLGKTVGKLNDDYQVLDGKVGSNTDQISALMVSVDTAKDGPSLEWGLYLGYLFNGNHGGELGFAIGAPVAGENGHLDFVARAYLLKNTTTNNYDVVLPTATQNTVDKNEVCRYADAAVRFRWDLLDGHFNPGIELGAGWQEHTNYRAITLLGETREMERSENQFIGIAGVGANGKIYGPVNWYFRLEGDTQKKGAAAAGLELDF